MNTTTRGATASICSQVTRTDGAPGQASSGWPPATCSISGTQCPPLNGGAPHSSANTRGRASPATAAWTLASRSRSPATTPWARRLDAGGPSDLQHPVQHLVQGAGIQGHHLGSAAQDVQGLVDVAGGDRADRAQVLGQHQVGAQVAGAVGVET